MSIDLSGVISTQYDPTVIRDYLEQTIAVELTDMLLGRNTCFKVFRFPNNSWSYTWRMRGFTRATVLEEFGAPPIMHPKIRKFTFEYQEIGTAVGITDRMVRFADIPAMEMAVDASIDAMKLKQDRDIINVEIASVPFYADASKHIYVRLQNADARFGEWRTFEMIDHLQNRCSKNKSHVIVGEPGRDVSTDLYPSPPEVSTTDVNKPFLLAALHKATELIEEHHGGKPNLCLMHPQQKTDFRNFLDYTGSNKPSIAPPQFNDVMLRGWVDNWEGINFIATHEMTPGTMLFMDTDKVCILGEYSAPFVEGGIRHQWQAWEGQTWRQYYNPACPNPDYLVLFLNLLGDTQADDTTPLDHVVKAQADAQYTKPPEAGGERAGIPG